MSSDTVALSIRNLTKTYRLFSHPGDRIKQLLCLGLKRYHREFTALRNVSFDVKRGETVGIIGRNGSGKSTLLQLVCGILKPTTGSLKINGRVAALLELGAGFNPEFTGRENVYFQGALMGLTTAQMDLRFDELAAFADIGEFIDQPVRTYSSGMFVRLAFAVASHINADIMMIDEAIAVGDLAFQARCFDRMKQLKDRGTTFLLVSHAMPQILANSDRALLLEGGSIVAYGDNVSAIVSDHEARSRSTTRSADTRYRDTAPLRRDIGEARFGTFEATISRVCIFQKGIETAVLQPGEPTEIVFHIDALRPFAAVVLGVSIRQPGSSDLWGDNNLLAGRPISLHAAANIVRYSFVFPLSEGEYLLYCGLADIKAGRRVELDQRWPVEKITVVAGRSQVGFAHGPITVAVEGDD